MTAREKKNIENNTKRRNTKTEYQMNEEFIFYLTFFFVVFSNEREKIFIKKLCSPLSIYLL